MNASTSVNRALVVYESMFGNTRRVAEAIADGLRQSGYDVRCDGVGSVAADDPIDVDLLVLGAPTHAFSLSRPSTRADAVSQGAEPAQTGLGLREWLGLARPVRAGVPLVAVFDTRVEKVRKLPVSAGPSAARLARRRGFQLLAKPAGFLVEDVKGPLCDGEVAQAARWGRVIGGLVRDHHMAGSRP